MKPPTPSTGTLGDKRRRAYQAGGRIARERMTREAPMNAAALDAIEASDIVVVEGCYDHVELVLGALDLPYQAGRRGRGWLKLKIEHTLDLVVLAVESLVVVAVLLHFVQPLALLHHLPEGC